MDLSDDQIASILSRSAESTGSPDNERLNLRAFSEQLIAIAQALRTEDLSALNDLIRGKNAQHHQIEYHDPNTMDGSKGVSDPLVQRQVYADMARHSYATRRNRTGIFGTTEIFGEPAWDILLDLYIAHVEGKAVSVSSACIGSASPPTTGLRWLGVLADHNFITREHDPDDQRRIIVKLTNHALECMDAYFASANPRKGNA